MRVRVIVQRPGQPEVRKEFSTSPVRLGRNPMNDLPLLETYVSEWHGAIRFEGESIEFTDLGSTNGTMLDGQKLTPGTPAPVAGSTLFQIGPLTMVVEPAFDAEDEAGVANTIMPAQPAVSGLPARAGELGAASAAATPPGVNPPTLFGGLPLVPPAPQPATGGAWGAEASGMAPPTNAPAAERFSQPAPENRNEAPRPRVSTEPAAPAFSPPTLFGVSAGILRPPSPAAAPVPVAPPPPAPEPELGANKIINPPSLFGFSPQDIMAAGLSAAASAAPVAPAVAPAPSEGGFPSFNPPTLFGDRAAALAPPAPAASPPAPAATGALGASKAASPPTLFGVASGAIAKPLPGMAQPRSVSPPPAGGGLPGMPAASPPGGAWGAVPSSPPAAAWAPPPEPLPPPSSRSGGAWSAPAPEAAPVNPPRAGGAWGAPAPEPAGQPSWPPSPPAAPPPAQAWAAPVPAAPAAPPAAGNLMDSAVGMTRAMGAGDRSELKTHAILRAFCDAFVDLRRGFEEAGSELGVRTVTGSTPLHTARDGADLMKYMTEPSADPMARAQELRSFIGDFASHQVAMMEGVNRGVRAVLASLDPQGYGIEKGPRFMPILDKERWRQYTERFGALLESDHELNALVFGAEFAEGYAEVIYGSQGGKRRR